MDPLWGDASLGKGLFVDLLCCLVRPFFLKEQEYIVGR